MPNNIANQLTVKWSNLLIWLLALAGMAILAMKCAVPLRSVDLWWHMAFGRHILETGKFIIDHSIFTWSPATSYHIYNAWLAEIALYLIYAKTGAAGLIVLGYLAHGGFFALAAYFALQRGVNTNPLTWVIITLGIVLSFMATNVQPELFSFTFMFITVWLYFTIRAMGMRAWLLCYIFPLIIMLWINSHGAFIMSVLFFLSVGSGELLNSRFSPTIAMPTPLKIHLFFAFLLCIPMLLINPFGYELPLHLLNNIFSTTAEITGLPNQIIGFDPTAKYNAPPYYALDYLLIAMSIFVFLIWQSLKNRRIDWVIILAFLAYSLMFTKFMRTTYFLAPVFVFSSLDLLAYKEHSWAWPATNIPKIALAVCCIAIIGFIGWRTTQGMMCHAYAGNLWASPNIRVSIASEETDYIKRMPSVKIIGNTYEDGGYLLYKLWPDKLAMIDSRYFPFKSWFNQYLKFNSGENVPSFLDKYRADVWLINHKNTALMRWFAKSNNWMPLFVGPAGVVFGHNNTSKTPVEISLNIEHTDSISALMQSFQTALILNNRLLAERIQTQIGSLTRSRPICTGYKILEREMQAILMR